MEKTQAQVAYEAARETVAFPIPEWTDLETELRDALAQVWHAGFTEGGRRLAEAIRPKPNAN